MSRGFCETWGFRPVQEFTLSISPEGRWLCGTRGARGGGGSRAWLAFCREFSGPTRVLPPCVPAIAETERNDSRFRRWLRFEWLPETWHWLFPAAPSARGPSPAGLWHGGSRRRDRNSGPAPGRAGRLGNLPVQLRPR